MTGADVLTVQEVAAELRCHPRTVSNLCRTGQLRAFRIGVNFRVTREALEAFKNGEQGSAA